MQKRSIMIVDIIGDKDRARVPFHRDPSDPEVANRPHRWRSLLDGLGTHIPGAYLAVVKFSGKIAHVLLCRMLKSRRLALTAPETDLVLEKDDCTSSNRLCKSPSLLCTPS